MRARDYWTRLGRGALALACFGLAVTATLAPAGRPLAAALVTSTIISPHSVANSSVYDKDAGLITVTGWVDIQDPTCAVTGIRCTVADTMPAVIRTADLAAATVGLEARGGPFAFTIDPSAAGLNLTPAASYDVTVQALTLDGMGAPGVEAVGDTARFALEQAQAAAPIANWAYVRTDGTPTPITGPATRQLGAASASTVAGQSLDATFESFFSDPATVADGAPSLIPYASPGLIDSSFLYGAGIPEGVVLEGVRATEGPTVTASSRYRRAVFLDRTAPDGAITAPADGSVFAITTVTIMGTVTDTVGGSSTPSFVRSANLNVMRGATTVFDGDVTLTSAGGFSRTLTGLPDGAYTATLTPTDYAGLTDGSPSVVNFVVDTVAPGHSAFSPADNANINVSPPSYDYTITDPAPSSDLATTRMVLSSLDAPGAGGNITGTAFDTGVFDLSIFGSSTLPISVPLPGLPDGFYRAVVTSTDNAGNSGSSTTHFTLDTVPPVLTFTAPPSGVTLFERTFSVTGTATDPAPSSGLSPAALLRLERLDMPGGAVVETVENRIVAIPGGSLNETFTVARDGAYRATWTATDNATNSTMAVREFCVNLPATIAIVQPGESVASTTVPVEVRVTDTNVVSVTIAIDGTPIPDSALTRSVAGDTTTFTATRTVSEGWHTLTATSVDMSPGCIPNVATASVRFIVDATAPAPPTIAIPTAGGVYSGLLTVKGEVTDNRALRRWTVTLYQGATPLATSVGSATGDRSKVTCAIDTTGRTDGSYSIGLRAEDLAGNLSTETMVAFIIDNTAPAITPPPTIIAGSPANIDFSVTEANFALARVIVRIDGVLQVVTEPSGPVGNVHSLRVNAGALTGARTLHIEVSDTARTPNTSSLSKQIIIDNVAPNRAEITQPSGSMGSPTVVPATVLDVRGVAEDAVGLASYSLSLDGTPVKSGDISGTSAQIQAALDISGMAAGSLHSVELTVTDMAGNSTTGTARFFRIFSDTTPPTAAITQPTGNPSVPRTVLEVRGTVTDAVQLKRYELYLDPTNPANPADGLVEAGDVSGTSAAIQATLPLGSLAIGAHTLVLRAIDTSGNTAVSAPQMFTIDNVAPNRAEITQPTGTMGSPTVVPATVLDVRGVVEDAVGLARYELQLDGSVIKSGDVSGTSAQVQAAIDVSGMAPGSDHSLILTAFDTAGNSTAGTTRFFRIFQDATPPAAAITQPTGNPTVPKTVLEVRGVVTDAAPGQLRSYELYLDPSNPANPADGLVESGDVSGNSANIQLTLTLGTLANGAHTLVLRAIDAAGNPGVSAPQMFTIDNTPPVAVITRPDPAGAPHTYSRMLEVRGRVTDATGINSWTLRLLQGVTELRRYTGAGKGATTDVSVSIDTRELADGSNYSVELVGVDLSGTPSAPATVAFAIDNTAPAVTIVSPTVDANGCLQDADPDTAGDQLDADPGTAGLQVRIRATIADAGSVTAVLRVDGAMTGSTLVGGVLNATVTLAEGSHTITVEATDSAETTPNTGSASLAFILDATGPEVRDLERRHVTPRVDERIGGALRILVRDTVSVAGHASDAVGLRRYELYLRGAGGDVLLAGDDLSGTVADFNGSFDTRGATNNTDGTYSLFFRVFDTCGRSTDSNLLEVIVDNTEAMTEFIIPAQDGRAMDGTLIPANTPIRANSLLPVTVRIEDPNHVDITGARITIHQGSRTAPDEDGDVVMLRVASDLKLVQALVKGDRAQGGRYRTNVRLTPGIFQRGVFYTIKLTGVKDKAGNAQSADRTATIVIRFR